MKDITDSKFVQISIDPNQGVLWINTQEEACVLRICQIKDMAVNVGNEEIFRLRAGIITRDQ